MVYSVVVEIRPRGSIGVFSLCRFTVDAASEQQAHDFAMAEAHSRDLETRAVWHPEIKGAE